MKSSTPNSSLSPCVPCIPHFRTTWPSDSSPWHPLDKPVWCSICNVLLNAVSQPQPCQCGFSPVATTVPQNPDARLCLMKMSPFSLSVTPFLPNFIDFLPDLTLNLCLTDISLQFYTGSHGNLTPPRSCDWLKDFIQNTMTAAWTERPWAYQDWGWICIYQHFMLYSYFHPC